MSTLALGAGCKAKEQEPLRIAAASDLTRTLTELAPRFEQKTGIRVVISYGASGTLADQITHGAPFDLFAAADRGPVDSVVRSGMCLAGTEKGYAIGQLAIVTRNGVPLPAALEGLGEEAIKRIAIANPDHAPYGRAAMEALTHAHLIDRVRPRLVFGSNVAQALEFVRSGNADAAIVARSLLARDATSTLVDRALHAPLVQTLVECTGGKAKREHAHAFADFLQSEEARAVLRESGFGEP